MQHTLVDAFNYFLGHQAELVTKYEGKFVVIKDGQILGAFDDEAVAVRETVKTHELGSFLVQRVSQGDTAYSHTFHSRVAFG